MKKLNSVIAFFMTICIVLCFDAIMNHVLKDVFEKDFLFDKIVKFLITLGRLFIGYYVGYKIIFPFIKTSLNE